MKSRAARMLETTLKEDDNNLQNTPAGQAGPGAITDPAGQPSSPADVQPTDQNPDAAALQQLLANYSAQPDGMADVVGQHSTMMDRWMDDQDKDVFTPESPEDKDAVMGAKNALTEAYNQLEKLRR